MVIYKILALLKCLKQCFGFEYVFMWIRIQDPKHVHMDPDPRRLTPLRKVTPKKFQLNTILP